MEWASYRHMLIFLKGGLSRKVDVSVFVFPHVMWLCIDGCSCCYRFMQTHFLETSQSEQFW